MKSIIQHPAPNVIAGVNFTEERFSEMFAWMSAMIADSIHPHLIANRYGLMIPFDGQAALKISQSGNQIILTRCCGITSAGALIGIFGETGKTPILKKTLPTDLNKGKIYQVKVFVDTQQRTPFGALSSDLPERPNFTMPFYDLDFRELKEVKETNKLIVEDLKEVKGTNSLVVGELAYDESNWVLISYIPACVHIGANPTLTSTLIDYQEKVNKMLEYLPKILYQTERYDDNHKIVLREFCRQIGCFLAPKNVEYQELNEYASPYKLINLWKGFASLTYFLVQSQSDDLRKKFYNLLEKNAHGKAGFLFNAHEFETLLSEVVSQRFESDNLLPLLVKITKMLDKIMTIFDILSKKVVFPTDNGPITPPIEESVTPPIHTNNPTW